MAEDYVHLEPGEEIHSIAGYYTMEKEMLLQHGGRDVLVVLGHTIIDGACCGAGGCRYALVPGYVVELRTGADEHGAPVSRVECIEDTAVRRELEDMIHARETITQVIFS